MIGGGDVLLLQTSDILPDVSEEKYREDAGMVEQDLRKIKGRLEKDRRS